MKQALILKKRQKEMLGAAASSSSYYYYVHSSHPSPPTVTTTYTHTPSSSSSSTSLHLSLPKSSSRRALTLSAPLLAVAALTAVTSTSSNSSNSSHCAWAVSAPISQDSASNTNTGTDSETLSNIPETLSGECISPNDCKKPRIQRPKSRKAESCTVKCVNTCIRGGDGAPGEGPLNIIRPLVVFKQGFRSRRYCLVECSDICNLMGDDDDNSPY